MISAVKADHRFMCVEDFFVFFLFFVFSTDDQN